jgi:hypothetical protein
MGGLKMVKKIEYPSQKELKRLFDYDPKSGGLINKVKRGKTTSIGKIIGTYKKAKKPHQSYRTQLYLKGKVYCFNKLVWIWHNGEIPKDKLVQHKDGDNTNCRIENLTLITFGQRTYQGQLKSQKKYHNVIEPGIIEVVKYKVSHQEKYIGTFDSLEEALKVKRELVEKLG